MTLTGNEIDIWLIEPQHIDATALADYQLLLSEQELTRAQRKLRPKDQHDAIITRAFVRSVLSHYEPIAPQQWSFGIGFNGKPFIENPDINLEFNLSHATNLIVCAVTRKQALGIDVEYIRRKSDTYKLADRYFSASEVQDLQALPHAQQAIDFYHYWTLKEAYIKACGDGLAIPLGHFSFSIANDHSVSISFDEKRNDNPQHWQHYLFHPTADHKMGLSVRVDSKQPLTITMRQFSDLHSSHVTTLPL